MSLDEAEAVFVRKPDTIDSKLMSQLAGPYEAPRGVKIQITLAADSKLSLVSPGQPVIPLVQLKGLTFRTLRCRRGNLADRIRKLQKALTSSGRYLVGANFRGVDLHEAELDETVFVDTDLSEVRIRRKPMTPTEAPLPILGALVQKQD